MKSLRPVYLLCGVIILAILLRFVELGSVPASPDWDEAANGYNAYSILKTGRDEYGAFLPAVLRSFDDYKPPLYAYLTIVPVWLFGLEPWVVRLPAAIGGTLGVLGVYFLVNELLKLAKTDIQKRWRYLPLIATFCLAISPWHVHFSRIGFEANIGVTLNIWFGVCFLKGLKKWRWLILATFLAGLALYSYHSERIFLPLLALFLLFYFRKQVFRYQFKLFVPLILGFLLIFPLIGVFSDPVNWTRLTNTSSLFEPTKLLARTLVKLEKDKAEGNQLGQILDNRRIVYVQKIVEGYLAHFSISWLFLSGDSIDRHHAPDMGLLYLVDLPFLLIGLYCLILRGGILSKILLFWFFIAPIAASPTNVVPQSVRTLVFLPTFQIFVGIGLIESVLWIATRRAIVLKAFIFVLICLYGLNITYYLHMYYEHMDREYSPAWQFGYRQAVDYVKANGYQYKQIVISTNLEEPYIFFLFYLKYDPEKYLQEGGSAPGRNHFDKFIFRRFQWDSEPKDPSILYIGRADEIPGLPLELIRYVGGSDDIKIAVR